MGAVYVTNCSESDHADSYGGVRYEFKRGATVEVPDVVASELLGYGHSRKEQFVVRLGWSKTNQDMPQALRKLAQFQIAHEPPRQNRVSPFAVGEVTPMSDATRGRKAIQRAA
jgi:hypothetical protein